MPFLVRAGAPDAGETSLIFGAGLDVRTGVGLVKSMSDMRLPAVDSKLKLLRVSMEALSLNSDDEKLGRPHLGQIHTPSLLFILEYMSFDRPLHLLWTQKPHWSQLTAGSDGRTALEHIPHVYFGTLGPGFSSMSPDVARQMSIASVPFAGRRRVLYLPDAGMMSAYAVCRGQALWLLTMGAVVSDMLASLDARK